jgi:hypothetical protein
MPEHHNSLSDAVADAMQRHKRNEEEAKRVAKKHTLMQQIAAQVEQIQNAPASDDDETRS